MIGSSPIIAEQRYGRGLEGLVAGDTAISEIDGAQGRLLYRGYPIEELVGRASFEEVTYLILFGEMPDAGRLGDWSAELLRWRHPPPAALGCPAASAGQRPPAGPVPDHDDGRRLPHPGT